MNAETESTTFARDSSSSKVVIYLKPAGESKGAKGRE